MAIKLLVHVSVFFPWLLHVLKVVLSMVDMVGPKGGHLGVAPFFFVELGWPILNPQNARSQDLKFNIAL
jgi:hypothetical protein